MRLITFSILFLSSVFVWGQNKYPSKAEVIKIITLTTAQKPNPSNSNSCESGLCGDWWIGNKDSSFYKTGILELYNSSNISSANNCTFKVWTFSNDHKFSETESNMCEEPPTMTIGNINDSIQKRQPNKFEIIENANGCFINIYDDNNLRDSYKVIGLVKTTDKNLGDQSYLLSIARQNNLLPITKVSLRPTGEQ